MLPSAPAATPISTGRLILAPMDGVLDPLMRGLLSQINPYDLCVTEFVRVVDMLLPKRTFYKLAPELLQGGKTASGTPVRVQLLGQSPEWLAENAVRAIELGSPGVDLNFGCPAKQVNQSKGGAVLLKEPDLMYRIITTVRQAVPDHLPVTAKIRLGWDNPADCLTIADAAAAAGATELAVHARTKEDGYRSEAIKWEWIAHIRERLSIPVIANGEIWSHADGVRCRTVTGCQDLMVGRGALNVPNLGAVVQHQAAVMPWSEVLQLLMHYGELEVQGDKSVYFPSRIKQWFRYLRQQYEQAQPLFGELRSCTEPALIMALLQREIAKLQG
ncbi:MAG: tRNA dihydrouridine(16) synthase DusC [Aeromonadaceae bacterium]|nr:tRNA dihydrouridine(16) synthase DusC [Aeromonadaceae bacterium]